MPNSTRLWSPVSSPSLAVPVTVGEMLTWEAFLMRLEMRLEEMAEGVEGAANVLEEAWMDQKGTFLSLTEKGVASVVESPTFREYLQETHGLRRTDFPMKVDKQEAEGPPNNLVDWVN